MFFSKKQENAGYREASLTSGFKINFLIMPCTRLFHCLKRGFFYEGPALSGKGRGG